MPLSPEQQSIFTTVSQDISQGRWLDLAVFMGMVYTPGLVAAVRKWFDKDKVEALYKLRLDDKDKVNADQSARIKQLEEALLKRPRK